MHLFQYIKHVGTYRLRNFHGKSIYHSDLNRSYTESDIVAVHKFMPHLWWTRNFMEYKEYQVMENIVYQDNKSTILLEKNKDSSSSKRTKHTNIRFFLLTDHISKKELNL